jgi:threonine/homoserine/homoserine lactone efflux protein
MALSDVLLGLTIGLPMMIAVGPISVLLLDQGLERGLRVAAPAALGVAAADLTFSTAAAAGGATLSAALAPVEGWLTLGAVAVLAWLAFGMARSALGELRLASTAGPVVADAHARELALVGAAAPAGAGDAIVEASPSGAFGHLRGVRLAAAFFGLTLVNPLTIVLFASVVIAGGAGVGSAGWALGMALASLIAHGSFVVLGGALGTTLGPVATARLRLGAAAFMGALALHFLWSAI